MFKYFDPQCWKSHCTLVHLHSLALERAKDTGGSLLYRREFWLLGGLYVFCRGRNKNNQTTCTTVNLSIKCPPSGLSWQVVKLITSQSPTSPSPTLVAHLIFIHCAHPGCIQFLGEVVGCVVSPLLLSPCINSNPEGHPTEGCFLVYTVKF